MAWQKYLWPEHPTFAYTGAHKDDTDTKINGFKNFSNIGHVNNHISHSKDKIHLQKLSANLCHFALKINTHHTQKPVCTFTSQLFSKTSTLFFTWLYVSYPRY